MNLFEKWSDLNYVIGDYRSRFDVLREALPQCKTQREAMIVLEVEGWSERYPNLPADPFPADGQWPDPPASTAPPGPATQAFFVSVPFDKTR